MQRKLILAALNEPVVIRRGISYDRQQITSMRKAMTQPTVSKKQLIDTLTLWHQNKIDNEQLQDWMVTHFDPPDTLIGEDEAELIQEAMHIIMNEYELAKLDKFKEQGYEFAMQFLKCTEENFVQLRHQFIHQGFSD